MIKQSKALHTLTLRVFALFTISRPLPLSPEREATAELLGAVGLVDLIIPRGSSSLIHFVREHAKVPVIDACRSISFTFILFNPDIDNHNV